MTSEGSGGMMCKRNDGILGNGGCDKEGKCGNHFKDEGKWLNEGIG